MGKEGVIPTEGKKGPTVQEMATYLGETIGDGLTALITLRDPEAEYGEFDARIDPEATGRWARGEEIPSIEAKRRLGVTYKVVQTLLVHDEPALAMHWLFGMNELTDEHAPAFMIATDPMRVIEAAEEFRTKG